MLWFLMGHLVCVGQWAAFIMVDHAFLGRGRRFRFPCLWAALLAAVFLAASIRHDIGFFNIGSVILNVIYLLVTVLFFGGSWNQKLSACLVNGIMCLLTENTVSYTFAWCKHIPVREVWRYRSCLFLLVAAVVGAGLLAAYIIRRWRREQALTPLQMLVMSFFPGIVVVLNIVLMVSGGSEVPSMMNMMLTFGLTIAVLIHLGIVQMVNDQMLQQQTLMVEAQREDDKFNRVDIRARNSKDEIILVEVQNTRELYYLERILYGVAKAITEHIDLGGIYANVKKVYSISILYFDIGQGNDYLYHGQNTFLGVHTGDCLKVTTKEQGAIIRKLPAEIFPEYFLIRVNEFNKVAVTPLEEWIEYLKTGTIRPDTTTPGLEEARQKLIYYNMNKADKLAYDRHLDALMIQNDVLSTAKLEGLEEGRVEGREEGIMVGRQEEKIATARNLKSLNIPIAVIVQATGLSIDEIDRL